MQGSSSGLSPRQWLRWRASVSVSLYCWTRLIRNQGCRSHLCLTRCTPSTASSPPSPPLLFCESIAHVSFSCQHCRSLTYARCLVIRSGIIWIEYNNIVSRVPKMATKEDWKEASFKDWMAKITTTTRPDDWVHPSCLLSPCGLKLTLIATQPISPKSFPHYQTCPTPPLPLPIGQNQGGRYSR